VHKRQKDGYKILMAPKKKARKAVKAKIRDIIRSGGATPMAMIVVRVNAVMVGWVNYFRVGNSSRAFSEVRDYLEMKIPHPSDATQAAAKDQHRMAAME
jgi:RNA-directed DNA polymerase